MQVIGVRTTINITTFNLIITISIIFHSWLCFCDIYQFYWAHHDSNPITYTTLAPQIT